jgi:hypothetical protein
MLVDLIEEIAKAMAQNEYRAIVGRQEFDWQEDTTRSQKDRYRALAAVAVDVIRTAQTDPLTTPE